MLRAFFLIFFLIGVAVVSVLGFRGQRTTNPPIMIFPDMDYQPKVRPQAPLGFFTDGRGMRPPVRGTVPIGYELPNPQAASSPGAPLTPNPAGEQDRLAFSVGSDYQNTGKMSATWGTGIPLPVNAELMQRGEQRFNINCAICHGPTAAGNGIVKQYGMATIISLLDERIRNMSDGEIFNTITHGKNTMFGYGHNVTVNDRWAIIAYLRALQRSQNATPADVPPEARIELEKQ
ncbi:MAG: ABC-type Fe3+ transport system protein; Molybdenum transport protein, putative [uncultured Chthoniobacterales bacterium]|uniref:ABC-type Fe3+ transport system protein Molybdenum transport protein, putative n=1 Tax=uncultured Chthoniobacterales bacterium TaxID=1836801 RepID=A0A6J4HLX0_9BACT|nr:MAG: ABC-type Fe3+ transport system protein; Molybdenum transport protein, putative [uncultured Chthoniobacterales bacterium]